MAKTQEPTAVLKEFMAAFKVDTTALEDAYKNTAVLNKKLAGVALDAAGKSSEISAKWTADTIARLTEISTAKSDQADYSNALSEYASAQADIAAGNMAAFAELAKNVQLETVELLVAAGKELSEDTAASVNAATNEAVKAAKSAAKK